jgi:hypothetical protein
MSNKPIIIKFTGPHPSTEVITIGHFTDNLVNDVTFEFNRYIGDIDLAQFYCMLHIENLGATLLQTKVSDSKLQAVLTVTTDITNFPGAHTASIKFVRDAGNLQYVWTTRNFDLIVERRVDLDKEIQHIDPTPLAGFIINLAANTARINDLEESKLDKPQEIQAGTFPKVTINQYGLVTEGHDLSSEDIPPIPISRVSGLTDELEAKAYYNPDAIARMTIDNVRQVIEWETADGSIHSYNLLVDKIPISVSFDPETNEIIFDQGEGEELRVSITHLVAGIVKSINSVAPDSSGNIILTVNDIPGITEAVEDRIETLTGEIDSKLADKADLVDGKVPLEQLPDIEITKAKVEAVLTGDITSHNHATEIGNHNTSETAHPFLKGKIDEAKAIAEGKSRARVFATKNALNTWLSNPENAALLQIGDHLYIEELDKPNYWWNGTTIVELGTQKVDLTEYAKKTELLTLGITENDAYRGDLGDIAYQHSQAPHAPSNAQKNSDITKAEIEAKLTGEISSHSHALPAHNHDDRYYTETEVNTKLSGKANTTHAHTKSEITDFPTSMTPTAHQHTKSDITDFPTIPTIPDITVDNGNAESGKYISAIVVDATNKHKLNITKENLPTLKQSIDEQSTHEDIPSAKAVEDRIETFVGEIDSKLADKADLVDGKVPLEQLPDIEITKQKVEDVLTGDITSHNHITEIGNHNTSEAAHPFLKGKIDEAKAIAEGRSRARVFATESALNSWLSNPENTALLQIGDHFYIEEIDKPNYWWNGTTIVELGTQKIDLIEYAKKTELLTLGTTENDAYRGDLGQIAYNHSQSAHAPSNAQKNSDITKAEIEAKLTGEISSHSHALPAHTHTKNEIIDLDNNLQEQIDGIDDTLQNHESRIGELELFAENLETNIIEEIEGTLENKADLVDGKVPLEQLPDIEITKQKVEAVLTGDITSHNHLTEIDNHNTSETAHTGIRNAVAEAKAIAEGRSRARVFATKSELDAWLLDSENAALLQIGDHLYIEELDEPNYWWNGTTIIELGTQKVDLTEYAKKSELLTLGTSSNDAYRGDLGQIAYNHSQSAHAPSNAQKNSDITKAEIEAKLTGEISSHSHNLLYSPLAHNHDARYYTETEVDTKLGGKADATHTHTKSEITDFPTSMTPTAHTHTKSEIIDFPTIPTIPDITVNNGSAEIGKYISQVAVDETDKHKLVITKADLPQGFSGNYDDLIGAPTIPTKTSDLTNDSSFTTEDAVQTKINTHNSSETAHTDIREYIEEARAIAEGKVSAMSFETKADLDAWLEIPENRETLLVGTNFYIEDLESPDYWWNGATLVELSTDKIDLTEYAKKTELLTLGTTENDAYRGDLGDIAYQHSQAPHAPSNAQKNSDITKAEIEAKLTGEISSHSHDLLYSSLTHNHDDTYAPKTHAHDYAATNHNHEGVYAPVLHDHDGVYSPEGHTHDNRYSQLGHNHTKSEITDFPTSMPPTAHNHDDRYYTESEVDTKLGGKADAAHTHTKSEITDFPTIPTVPTISNNIAEDAENTSKTTSPKAVKDYVDAVVGDFAAALMAIVGV